MSFGRGQALVEQMKCDTGVQIFEGLAEAPAFGGLWAAVSRCVKGKANDDVGNRVLAEDAS